MSLHDLHSIAGYVRAHGRGDDTALVHMTPDEVDALAELQGGYIINPETGLPEFGLLGKILKGVVRAGAGVLGGMFGGPAGAAAGAGLATKLTGGSWKDALTTGAMSGLGAGLGNLGSGAKFMAPLGATNAASTAGLDWMGAAVPQQSFGSQFMGALGSQAGIGVALPAGLSALASSPSSGNSSAPPPWFNQAPQGPSRIEPIAPGTPWGSGAPTRELVPYTGEWATYGERGEHNWWRPIAQPAAMSVPTVGNYGDAASEMSFLPPAGTQASVEQRHLNPMMPDYYLPDLYPHYEFARGGRAAARGRARLGISLAAKMGRIADAGAGGKDDVVPAMLAPEEHVVDAATVADLGDGNSNEGHRRMEKIKTEIRRRAGRKNPRRPTRSQGGLESVMKIIPKAA